MNYAVAVDTTGKMSKTINIRGIPHVLVISTDGIVRWQGFPLADDDPLTDKTIQQIVDADPGVAARHSDHSK